ncbi:hypothetical protein JCM39194_11420 [Desulfotomaculum varum]
MQVITFGKLQAQDGQGDALMDIIRQHMDYLKQQPGLVQGYVARCNGNSNKFLVVSVWANEEAQQAAMTRLSTDPAATKGFLQMMQLLNGQPDFGNYTVESIVK